MPKRITEVKPAARIAMTREESIIRSVIVSSAIEGIVISPAKARAMYKRAYARFKHSA